MARRFRAVGWLIAGLLVVAVAIAIKATRDSAERSQCRNNLLQIGLALLNYESTFQVFPSATQPNRDLPPQRRLSWLASILPFLEGGGKWYIDRAKAWDDGENRLIRRGMKESDEVYLAEDVQCFHCPASGHSTDSAGQGLSDYVAVAGLGVDAPVLPAGDPRAGIFGYERTTTVEQIKDGSASTMAVIETSDGNGPWKAGGAATIRGLDPGRQPYIGPGRQFGGAHRDGVMVLFADGSVRFLRATIDPKVFEALSTIAGGENLPSGWDRSGQ
ncbi:MAG TPA: DUF1559 domain-containing protein [Isosphaeraceae bacterium]|nr:DUF1559 domain-containing protein [Isosphaeraceae bacterium]